jgi:tRNA pseudouridine65 synthase
LFVPILYQDAHVLVVDKPGGLLVHRSREARREPALLQIVRDQSGHYLYPAHRLDRATSGVLAFGLDSQAAAGLQAGLQAPSARKTYHVLVRGMLPEAGESVRPLTNRTTGRKQEARSTWRRRAVIELPESTLSLAAVWLHTGRRHQIRRHMAALAHQVVGDTTYGKGRLNRALREQFGLPRLALHASSLEVDHPAGAGRLRVRAPLAADLRAFLMRLPGIDPEQIAGM